MSTKQYDTIVYIGRFQPFHIGHYKTLLQATDMAEKVIVLVGSAYKPRTIRDPFTFEERKEMIESCFKEASWADKSLSLLHKISIVPLEDNLYDDNSWAENVQQLVYTMAGTAVSAGKIGLIGFEKDESSFYLKMFPQWERIETPFIKKLNGTDIRDAYFSFPPPGLSGRIKTGCPLAVAIFMERFQETPNYKNLVKEWTHIQKYKESWADSPFPPVFVTVDAVVIYCGHVLLIKRKAVPGKGLWALPGGFIKENEKVKDACLRELYEESKLGLFTSELLSMLRSSDVFDNPRRSLRGRTITHAFYFSTVLPFERLEGKMPRVKGGDDAEVARWFPLREVMRMGEYLFEDHKEIISFYL